MKGISTKTASPLEKFYSQYFMFSYSSLNKLIHSAQLFHNWYILKERSDGLESHLVEGKVVHCLLLEEKTFEKQFIVMIGDLPSSSNKKITEAIYKIWKQDPRPTLADYKVEILELLTRINLHQGLKDDKDGVITADIKRIGKVVTAKTNAYFSYLQKSANKDVIDQATYDKCLEAVMALRSNLKVKDLMKLGEEENNPFRSFDVYNENMLSCKLNKYPFGLKGIVDNYVIDHDTKTVRINDLKTTGKTLREFQDSIEYYKYWMQAAIYVRLVKAQYGKALADYKFTFNFVVIDKYNQVYPFPCSDHSMKKWQTQLDGILEKAKYHYINKDYTLPYEFAMNQVEL